MTLQVVVPDTSLLRSFDRVGRLDLVEAFCGGMRAEWALEVQSECTAQELDVDRLGCLFGAGIAASVVEQANAKTLRTLFFASSDEPRPRQDMGECVTLVIWSDNARRASAPFVLVLTEDRNAAAFCNRTQMANSQENHAVGGARFVPVTCHDLLQSLVTRGLLSEAESQQVRSSIIDGAARGWLGPGRLVTYR